MTTTKTVYDVHAIKANGMPIVFRELDDPNVVYGPGYSHLYVSIEYVRSYPCPSVPKTF